MKNQNTKLIVILALIVAVVGLTLGFAAFSNQLKILSSATVSPDASDFKLTIYGLEQIPHSGINLSDSTTIEQFTSKVSSLPYVDGITATTAVINNNSLTISNLSATFTEPNQDVTYYFMIKNEGEYDAYLDFSDSSSDKTCTPVVSTNINLVEQVCDIINLDFYFYDSSGQKVLVASDIPDYYEDGEYPVLFLAKNDYLFIKATIKYSDNIRIDGPLDIQFSDFKFIASTAQ